MAILGRVQMLSTALGLVMSAAAGIHTTGTTLAIAALAAVAVLVGIGFRVAATFAVLLAGAAVMLSDFPPWMAGVTGLFASGYLVLRHTAVTWPAGDKSPVLIVAVGLTAIGVLVAAVSLELPWLPLLAPVAVLAVYLLVTWPFFGGALQSR